MSSYTSSSCQHFDFLEIQLATENFNESLVVGRGGFGKVYAGTIFNGSSSITVAIKRLDYTSHQGATEFWAEVEMLTKLRHCNLVSLIGYCNHKKEMILVYEYMPNGTLSDHLHELGTSLSWLQRLKICIGAARGLQYLHTGTGIEFGVIHRDVKSSNILLHESWAAKISDFGLSKVAKISDFGLSKVGPTNQPFTGVSTAVKGTFGYLDPDYYATGKLTRKSDVYAFGVVLLEMLCRKRAVDKSLDQDQWNLARWAQESIKAGNLRRIIDPDIGGQIYPKCLKEFVRIAERCLHNNPQKRSTMAEVVASLESVLALQEKINSSMQASGKTIFGRIVDRLYFPYNVEQFGRIVDKLYFPYNGEHTAHGDSKVASDIKGNNKCTNNSIGPDNTLGPNYNMYASRSLKVYQFSDLRKATNYFSQDSQFGKGNFGEVFLAWVDKNTFTPSRRGDGIAVAIRRRCSLSNHGHDQLLAEVGILGPLAHPNIITLLGYSSHEHEYLCVYEYMQNGSFDQFINRDAPDTIGPLTWRTRLNILIGVACGLTYLHSLKDQVIHRNVKSSSIFLDQDYNAKLGNFGLARSGPEMGKTHVTTRVAGTLGYIDPNSWDTGHFSVKSDIYGFGVVMLETLTGLPVIDGNRSHDQHNLVEWASPILTDRRELREIMDPHLGENYPEEGVFKYAKLALRCLAINPKERPSSEKLLRNLEHIYALNK